MAKVEDDSTELTRTPSVQRDTAAATAAGIARRSFSDGGKSAASKAQLRALDADIAEVRVSWCVQSASRTVGQATPCDELHCRRLWRGFPTGARLLLRAASCSSYACFGASVVKNECQIGGRFDSDLVLPIGIEAQGAVPCHCSHRVPLRAFLCTRSAGNAASSQSRRDGEDEDINSPGTSPHKTYLLARRRWAEAQVEQQGGALDDEDDVRTFTEKRRMSATRGKARPQLRGPVALADKLNELAELQDDRSASALETCEGKRRTCAQCHGQFADFEGG